MISFEEAFRLANLQARVRNATFHEMKKDGHHKSSEGAVALSFCLPPVVGDDRAPYWSVEVYSYLLCPQARSETWVGKSAAEAISKAEDAISNWCISSEMEQFATALGIKDDDDIGEPQEEDMPA